MSRPTADRHGPRDDRGPRFARDTTARAIAAGLAVAALYVAFAMWSGHMSPLARRPALDGLGHLVPYRWVSPPPEVADNQPPVPGSFEIPVSGRRSETFVAVTPDNQVTVLLDEGAIATGADRVRLEVDPVDPVELGPLPGDLVPFGNAVRLRVTPEPRGGSIGSFRTVITTLIYPETTSLHALEHEMLWSGDGHVWERLDTREVQAISQVEAEVPAPGYVVAGGVPRVLASPRPPGAGSGGAGPLATVLLVASVSSLLLGVGMLVRARRG